LPSRLDALWAGKIGSDYARQTIGVGPSGVDAHWWPMLERSRVSIDRRILSDIPRTASILEVGCGVGNMMACLGEQGFVDLTGADINADAVDACRARGFTAVKSSATALPFGDGAFDLVYTSALLIHIAAEELAAVQREIARVARRWVYGYEYWSPVRFSRESTLGGLVPQGVPGFTHKAPFCNLYLVNVPGLAVAKQERVNHADGTGNADEAFLLAKGN
jgi:SAM-dependent methyltransferase